MSLAAADIEPRRNTDAGDKAGKAKLMTLDDMDGRTRAAQAVKATIDSLAADLGGEESLSTAEMAIIRRAAVCGAMAESIAVQWLTGEAVDPGTFSALSNNERRLLETVGLKRRPRDVTNLKDYVAKTYGGAA